MGCSIRVPLPDARPEDEQHPGFGNVPPHLATKARRATQNQRPTRSASWAPGPCKQQGITCHGRSFRAPSTRARPARDLGLREALSLWVGLGGHELTSGCCSGHLRPNQFGRAPRSGTSQQRMRLLPADQRTRHAALQREAPSVSVYPLSLGPRKCAIHLWLSARGRRLCRLAGRGDRSELSRKTLALQPVPSHPACDQ